MKKVKLRAYAPAKINLGLEVLSKRFDGYHDVDMIMQTIDLFDEVTLETTKERKITVINKKNFYCPQERDIAFKCAKVFFEEARIFNEGIRIKIDKNIPISAGLAGGSADGAATLLLLNKIYGDVFSFSQLCEIGGKIGADIPFCILGGAARAKGKGTDLKKLPDFSGYFLVVVKPEVSVSTREAYSAFDNLPKVEAKSLDLLEMALKEGNLRELSVRVFNRFELLTKEPEVFKLKEQFLTLGASASLMSGSGSSVYGIFGTESAAKSCFEELKKQYSQVFFCRPIGFGAKIL